MYNARRPKTPDQVSRRFLIRMGCTTPEKLAEMRDWMRRSNDPKDRRTAEVAETMRQEAVNDVSF